MLVTVVAGLLSVSESASCDVPHRPISVFAQLSLPSGRVVTFRGELKETWLLTLVLNDTGAPLNAEESAIVEKFLVENLNKSLESGGCGIISIFEMDTRLEPELDASLIEQTKTFFRDKTEPLTDVKNVEADLAKSIDAHLAISKPIVRLVSFLERTTGRSVKSVRLARETWSLQRAGEVGMPLAEFYQKARGGFATGPIIQCIFREEVSESGSTCN